MSKEMERYKKICADRFSTHKATVITENDRYFILDWRREDGGGDWYINFIVDKKRGAFIVSGDLGNSIAVWYCPDTPENIRNYIQDIDCYVGKIGCASDLYVYDSDCGRRIDGRVYIWSIAFRMAMKQLGR